MLSQKQYCHQKRFQTVGKIHMANPHLELAYLSPHQNSHQLENSPDATNVCCLIE